MDLDALYQDIILDHYKHPRNYGPIASEEVLMDEENPLCGDHIRLTAAVKDGVVQSVRFDGKGCAISMASSSMMTESVIDKPIEEARGVIRSFLASMRGDHPMDPEQAGDLIALEGVKKYPLRIKCATLGWHAIETALQKIAPHQ
ncbi:MAG TPA: SUF system NifU family Fe-S cluster assembly protein [Verrucomicrobia bacterium]|nr:MAG: SUF system NifU family Fe-S cluster assembly protein [Lentisphaerae bacterium GWF2_57_35]HBA85341.1 SUF system NifU family Fe-S cluster assembly protein [Verrucomicrobiota bacterium]